MLRLFTVSCAVLLGAGCGLSTHVRPVPKGQLALEASVGGPAARLGGAAIPLPMSTLGASYGVAERVDVSAHTHLTSLAAFKLAGLDLSGTYLALEESGAVPALALTARGYAFTDFASGTLWYADLSATASYSLGTRTLLFGTLTGQLVAIDGSAHWSPGVGAQFTFGRVALEAEVRWYDASYDVRSSSVSWLSPFKQGALGLVLGVSYRPTASPPFTPSVSAGGSAL
ncbi:MAG: hypothetical protein ACYC8T_18075 [Myxococcaceae bacterium]